MATLTNFAPFKSFSINCQHRLIEFDHPVVMGILNISKDSFFDGGKYRAPDAMVLQAKKLIEGGSDIIDVGAVSTRPGAKLADPEMESQVLETAIRRLREEFPEVIISVDTCFSVPARRSVEAGADIINDISGGQFDEEIFSTIADLDVPYILTHTRGLPHQMMDDTHYDDLIGDLAQYFSLRLGRLRSLGVKDVWIDPGFGFAKTAEQNFELVRRLNELTELFDEPLVVGFSRKSMIYNILGCTSNEALNGTTVLNTLALTQGARILRVHDPREARETIQLITAVGE